MGEHSIDDSDRTTGLPPLNVVEEQVPFYVTSYATQAGTVGGKAFDEPVPVCFLAVRGFTPATQAQVDAGEKIINWGQHCIAINVANVLDIAASLTSGETVAPPPDNPDPWREAIAPCAAVLADRLGLPQRDSTNAAMAVLIEARSVLTS